MPTTGFDDTRNALDVARHTPSEPNRLLKCAGLMPKTGYLLMGLFSVGPCLSAHAQQASETSIEQQTVSNQWFTGSLVSPSPALPVAGLVAIEPYDIVTLNTGSYDARGNHHGGSNNPRSNTELSLLEYSITKRLSIETIPVGTYAWNSKTTSHGEEIADLPVDLKYRVLDQNTVTGAPSVTFDLGMEFPTGPHDQLATGLDGAGGGSFNLRQGITLQSLFDTWGNHPLRIRVWEQFQLPLTHPSVKDVSVYGTGAGFNGTAHPGDQWAAGISPEYAINQRWLLATDIVYSYADGSRVRGEDAFGGNVNFSSGSSKNWSFAPAVEYNWSWQYGVIAGVQYTLAGHNTSSYVAPQIALNMVF